MATYIPNITDIIPEPSLYTPDFNRMERMLRMREGMYKQGAQRVKSLYSSAFNSPMLRDSNIQKRDAYLSAINDGLKAVSAMDLSVPENQNIADNLFQPVLNDKDLWKDRNFTASLQAEQTRAEQYRMSQDPVTRKQYWDTGMKALQYQADEFKNADNETALNMGTPKYTPQVDLFELSQKMYKDAGISITQDSVNGGYIITQKNGANAMPLTQSMMNMMFEQDPAIKAMIQTQAYVTRKEEIQARAPKYKGNMALAEQEYLNEVIGSLGAQQNAVLDVDNASLKTAREKVEKWTNLIFSKGIVPGSKEHDDYEADLAKLDMLEKTVSHGRTNLLQMQNIDKTNPIDLRTAADSAVSSVLYQNLTGKLAEFLAFKNADVKIKPDPFALASHNSSLSLQRAQIMESIRQSNRVKTLEKRKELGLGDGSSNKNSGATVLDANGKPVIVEKPNVKD
jgi:hypothetical protein